MAQAATDRLFVATRKGLFTVERGGGGWNVQDVAFLGDNVSYVLPDRRGGQVLAALELGHFGVKLHRSLDGGRRFEPVAEPAFPPKPEGVVDVDGAGNPIPWRVERIWSLAHGGGDTLWCGTHPGALFRSRDGGQSWTLNRPLWDEPGRQKWFGGGYDHPGIHSICVHPRDPHRLLLAVSSGGVWSSGDGGETWHVRTDGMFAEYMPPERRFDPFVQDPHCMVQCRDEPEHVWVQHHNGIFYSSDGGLHYREVDRLTPSRFGFAVAVDPRHGGTAWFVPAVKDACRLPVDGRLVVVRTRDGGETHEVLRRGLPQAHSYDLVYRHGLDVDAAGERLAFGSTTGSLYVSDDQGDSWQEISAHLPPIYCVRFDC